MADLIGELGYVAVFIGTFLEGETVLALGGVAAAHGYLTFPRVVMVAIAGAFVGDQFWFFIGRRYGARMLARYPGLAAKVPRVQALLHRWHAPAVILLRFLYGLRIAGPILIGSLGLSPWRLAALNFIGALLWAPLVAGIGYVAWQAIEVWIGRMHDVQLVLLMLVIFAIVIGWLVVRLRRKS